MTAADAQSRSETRDAHALSSHIIDAAVAVHRALGPGLPKRAYADHLADELRKRGNRVHTGVSLPMRYDDAQPPKAAIDILVDDTIIVELETVPRLAAEHEARLFTHLHVSRYAVGILINFHAPKLADGVLRIVNRH